MSETDIPNMLIDSFESRIGRKLKDRERGVLAEIIGKHIKGIQEYKIYSRRQLEKENEELKKDLQETIDYLEWCALQVNMEHLPKFTEWKEQSK